MFLAAPVFCHYPNYYVNELHTPSSIASDNLVTPSPINNLKVYIHITRECDLIIVLTENRDSY